MSTKQPKWKLLANLGDSHPIDYGGYFVYVDETGVYAPEAELLISPDSDDGAWEVYRWSLDRCTYQNGILSDNKFHPDKAAWFAKPESKRAERPQDTTYLSNVAECNDITEAELIEAFCSEDPLKLAFAYREVGEYHGFNNFDSYPLTFNSRAEVESRYSEELS